MPNNFNKKNKITLELRFLIACCQAEPTEDNIEFILQYIAENSYEDLQKLIPLAFYHGVLPLVYKSTKNLPSTLYPLPSFISELKSHYQSIAKKNMLMSAELIQIIKLLKENNIEVLAFKGPALSKIAYSDITLRQFGDLDILVKKEDFKFLADKLLEKKFIPLFPIETFHEDKVMFEMNNDCPFYNRQRGIAIEIHWDFFRKLALPTKKFTPWEDTHSITINGSTIKTLSHETHLLYHSLHGAKHIWERLEWIVDIDRFIRSVPDLNWDRLLTMSKEMGAQKMFLSGIALSEKYFHTPLPKHITLLCKEVKLESFITYVESELNTLSPKSEESLTKLSKIIGLRDNIYYKTVTILEFLFRPGINERRTVILSNRWFWLYWFLRPIGMLWRFIFCKTMKLCR